MSVEEAAKMLRGAAELTAKGSQNWDNYQAICLGVLNDALSAGRKWVEEGPYFRVEAEPPKPALNPIEEWKDKGPYK